MGENVTTRGIDLLGLPTGARLHLGATAVVEVTGLRNPCAQLDRHPAGPDGGDARARRRRATWSARPASWAIVLAGGEVRPGDPIRVELPPEPHQPLAPV